MNSHRNEEKCRLELLKIEAGILKVKADLAAKKRQQKQPIKKDNNGKQRN